MNDTALEAFLDLLKLLVREPSVVGAETSFFRVLQRELELRGAKVTRFEGLLVAEGADPESMMFSAHIDRHGIVATGPREFQYAAFVARNQGDLTGDSISEQTFQNVAGRFLGERVHAYEPWTGGYLGQAEIRKVHLCPRLNNLIFELDGLGGLIPGSPVGYFDQLEIGKKTLRAQLDNVLTTAALVHLFALGFQGRAFFTAQEEAGRSWRFLWDWFRRENRDSGKLLVLDTSPFADAELAGRQEIVLRHRDAAGSFCPETVEEVRAACEALGIRYTYKDDLINLQNQARLAEGKKLRSLGQTELGRVAAAAQGKINGATIQIPTTGYHTRQETASLKSVTDFIRLLTTLSIR